MNPVNSWRCAQPTETKYLETAPTRITQRNELTAMVRDNGRKAMFDALCKEWKAGIP
jgi:hypothetical protein